MRAAAATAGPAWDAAAAAAAANGYPFLDDSCGRHSDGHVGSCCVPHRQDDDS